MITIVSGLPRSGTSLMMQMLAAGGMTVMSDEARPADEHNPRGYLEDRRVKGLQRDNSWVGEADGHVLKVVSLLLYDLPQDLQYRVIFMRRDLDEVLRSQHSMLGQESKDAAPTPEIRKHFERHLAALKDWLPKQSHIDLIEVEHRRAITEPHDTATTVQQFLQIDLDVTAMASVVDQSLYRQRTGDLSP
ncbi:MAG: sulfotransferase family protein [Planctomycetaceae bacterium]|nr:sulfotransferase family protein [Planctomycetaceae bacterium]